LAEQVPALIELSLKLGQAGAAAVAVDVILNSPANRCITQPVLLFHE
jgi:hypothetical protein